MIRLWFDKGTLLLKGEVGTPYGKWDPRVGCYRIKALHYGDVLSYLKESKLPYQDEVTNLPPLQTLKDKIELRTYQERAHFYYSFLKEVLTVPFWKPFE